MVGRGEGGGEGGGEGREEGRGGGEGQGSNLRCMSGNANPPLDPVLGKLIELSEDK